MALSGVLLIGDRPHIATFGGVSALGVKIPGSKRLDSHDGRTITRRLLPGILTPSAETM